MIVEKEVMHMSLPVTVFEDTPISESETIQKL
jgi:hypothetical protein